LYGLWRKTSLFQNKNRMTSELTSFAARLRGFIAETRVPAGRLPGADPANHEATFNALAQELFRLQFKHNSAYQRLCIARGLSPENLVHWSQIPCVPAAAFKELEFTCIPPGERVGAFLSSGTTGQSRSRHFHCAESLELYEASLWPWFAGHVLAGWVEGSCSAAEAPSAGAEAVAINPGIRLLSLTPPPAMAPNSSLVHMFDTVRHRIDSLRSTGGQGTHPTSSVEFVGDVDAGGGWTLDHGRVCEWLQSAVAAGQPVVLMGTAFNFVNLADALAGQGTSVRLPTGSRVMETGGYKGRSRELSKAELHRLIGERLGVPRSEIICEYGMSEISSQAYDGVAGTGKVDASGERVFAFPPWCRAQIVSPETGSEVAEGETGVIRLFDLANAFSVMALQTEDLAVRRREGFELIGRAVAAEPRGCSLMPV